jgi:hypothetical protein
MRSIEVKGIIHDFGKKGSGEVEVVALNCDGCNQQCAFSGLFIQDGTIDSETRAVTSGRASTSVYVTDNIEDLEKRPLKEMERLDLELGIIVEPVSLMELNMFSVERVMKIIEQGRCLVDLARDQQAKAIL